MTMGNRIKAKRRELGLTQAQLGRRVGGLNKSSISQWENDTTAPDRENLTRLCGIFGCTSEWLQFGDERQSTALSDAEAELCRHFRSMEPDKKAALLTVAKGLTRAA